ncbi:unnamed protein product [Aureobasidium mustum]|uniref:Uncharacterized protein n=1 Tax=Aureobasidium mustum TaxID=2773714 RepID=A0A9N8KBJ7_9PEZI|nr:unnamed protein product [Aureobasidium mustum]
MSQTSHRTCLDAATASKLLSSVTPPDGKVMGLGITCYNTPSSKPPVETCCVDSMRSCNVRSYLSSTLKLPNLTTTQSDPHDREASNVPISASKGSAGATITPDDSPSGLLGMEKKNDPPRRWPSGVPGLGNTILGPRLPMMSSYPITPRQSSPKLNDSATSNHITSSTKEPLASPSRKPCRAIRTNTKRRAISPPSGAEPAAKVAKLPPGTSIYAQAPARKQKQTEEQNMPAKRFGPRRLGTASETEKREKAAKLWQAEKEKLLEEMKKAVDCEEVKALSDEIHSNVDKQHGAQNGSQPLGSDVVIEGRAEVASLSPEAKKIMEYACEDADDSSQLFIQQHDELGKTHIGHKEPGASTQRASPDRRSTKDHPSTTLGCTTGTNNTQGRNHPLPSALKRRGSTPTSSGKRVSFDRTSRLVDLIKEVRGFLLPYTHLHSSCPTVRPLQIIHNSLTSPSLTAATLSKALKDAQELLKVLVAHQTTTLNDLEITREALQRVGMEGVLRHAKARVQDTEADVQKLEKWMAECHSLAGEP